MTVQKHSYTKASLRKKAFSTELFEKIRTKKLSYIVPVKY